MTSKHLNELPSNKTVVFYSPIEGPDVLVRFGTPNNNLSLFHAILNGCSKEYAKLDSEGKMKLSEKYSKDINDLLYKKQWEEEVSKNKESFQNNINDILCDFYKYVTKDEKCRHNSTKDIIDNIGKNIESYKIISELVKLENFENDILPAAYEKCKSKSLEMCKKIIIEETNTFCQQIFDSMGDSLDEPRKKFCMDKISNLISQIIEQSDKKSYKKYLRSFRDRSLLMDSYTADILCETFNCNIYFLNYKNRMPHKIQDTQGTKENSIVLLQFENHYETVGKLLENKKIQRKFNNEDSLISIITTFLYKPRNIAKKYPHLIKSSYNSNSSSNDSEEEPDDKMKSSRSSSTSEE
jgi:hypothetical protein